jgi:hypothetical protein
MKKHTLQKKHVYIIIAILFVFFIVSVFSFLRRPENHFYGQVLSMSWSSIVISNEKLGEKDISLHENTKIYSGREVVDTLSVWEQVLITTRPWKEWKPEAVGIRVLQESRN